MSATPIFAGDYVGIAKTVLPADSTNLVDVYDNSAGTKAVVVDALNVCTDNTADLTFKVWVYSGSTAYLVGSVTVTTLAGTNGNTTPRANVLSVLGIAGADGVPAIVVPAGAKLQASVAVAVAANKTAWVTGRGKSYA